MTLINNDNKPPMRVVRQHTWGALLIYRRIPLAKTQRTQRNCLRQALVHIKKRINVIITNINAFFSCWLLAVEPKKFKSLSSKAKSLSLNQPSTSSLVK